MWIIVFLLLLANSFSLMMESSKPKEYLFHRLIEEVAHGRFAGKLVIEEMEKLKDKNPNDKYNRRTAA